MDALSNGKLTGAQKEELMDQVKQQVAVLLAQELLQKITEKCFKKCVHKPGTSLDNSEQSNLDSSNLWIIHSLGPVTGKVPIAFLIRIWINSKNAFPCVWTDTWIPLDSCHGPMRVDCNERRVADGELRLINV